MGPEALALEVCVRASVRAPAVMVVGVEVRAAGVVVARRAWRLLVMARSTAAKGRYLLASSGGAGRAGSLPPFVMSTSPLGVLCFLSGLG